MVIRLYLEKVLTIDGENWLSPTSLSFLHHVIIFFHDVFKI